MLNPDKVRRETMRWNILLTLYNARPIGAYMELILPTLQAIFPDATSREVLNELDYLNTRELIVCKKSPDGRHHAVLARWGIDIVEYTVDCEPGIARPEKYWN